MLLSSKLLASLPWPASLTAFLFPVLLSRSSYHIVFGCSGFGLPVSGLESKYFFSSSHLEQVRNHSLCSDRSTLSHMPTNPSFCRSMRGSSDQAWGMRHVSNLDHMRKDWREGLGSISSTPPPPNKQGRHPQSNSNCFQKMIPGKQHMHHILSWLSVIYKILSHVTRSSLVSSFEDLSRISLMYFHSADLLTQVENVHVHASAMTLPLCRPPQMLWWRSHTIQRSYNPA